ncbi:hypothetical protein B0H17DRAFT_1146180 [Mycena rosella]|uniref:Uncharacterized protein n=1 Tax=Mycena rosella TaxID=1033263 RepID=A0AAD7CPF4_MYCRO|nr:hypothetical protein B0H17DRAFT_1146180 [Mycena rosella]
MDDEGHTKSINVSASRTLIAISKTQVLVPGAIISLHKTLEWISTRGAKMFSIAAPAPSIPSDEDAEFCPTLPADPRIQFEHWSENQDGNLEDSDKDSDDEDSESGDEKHGHLAFELQPDAMEGIEDELSGFNINDTTPHRFPSK